jgi:methylated-DNA-[protein]-cysteine S-methyltransferase
MLYHLIIKTSFGYCGILFTKTPFVLKQISLPQKNIEKIFSKIESIQDNKNAKVKKIASEIKNYFDNKTPIKINLDTLDLNNQPPFYKKVLLKTAEIPFSETCSYKDIAEEVKKPKAYRAVGNALANNPFPIIIPCHRVTKFDGSLGKFGGGTELKRKMINLEQA